MKKLSLLYFLFLSACTTSPPTIDFEKIDRTIPIMEVINNPPIQTRISKNEVVKLSGTINKDTVHHNESLNLYYEFKNISNSSIDVTKPNTCNTSFILIKDGKSYNHPSVGYIECWNVAPKFLLSPNESYIDSVNMNYFRQTFGGGNFEIKITHHYVEKGKISIEGFKFYVFPPTQEEKDFRTFDTLSIADLRMNLGKELIEKYPNNNKIEWIEHSMAGILFDQKRYPESIKALKKLISKKNSSDGVKHSAYGTLAEIYKETKQKEKAIKTVSKTYGRKWSKKERVRWYNNYRE